MRYKVKARDDFAYRDILSVLEGRVPIFVASEKRRLLSTGDLSDDCRQEIVSRGGQVSLDSQYDPDLKS